MERLRRRGSDDEDKIKTRLEIAEKELAQAKAEGFHDKIFINDDLQKTYEQLERYIFDGDDEIAADEVNETSEVANTEVEMVDRNGAVGEVAAKVDVNGSADATTNATDTPTKEKSSAMEAEDASK